MKLNQYLRFSWESLLPIVICLVLPWLNIIASSQYLREMGVGDTIIRWLSGSMIVFGTWNANAWLFDSGAPRGRAWRILGGNLLIFAALIGLVIFLEKVQPDWNQGQPLGMLYFRIGLAVVTIVAIQGSFRAIRQNERLKTENFALQTENYKAQLDQLKRQVNPHFLFNSLSTLQTMIHTGNAQSEAFVFNLSDVYRRLLQTRETQEVSLADELEFLNAYLYLLRVRHDDALEVEIVTRPESFCYKLPSFALQLLVENCTKHNIVSESRPLKIEIWQSDPHHITVANNYQPKKNVTSFGVGLDNLRKRYALLKIDGGVQVQRDPAVYSVTLKLIP
ncbi:MAG: sensor histidine kinase [Bacteroidota bacterium]